MPDNAPHDDAAAGLGAGLSDAKLDQFRALAKRSQGIAPMEEFVGMARHLGRANLRLIREVRRLSRALENRR